MTGVSWLCEHYHCNVYGLVFASGYLPEFLVFVGMENLIDLLTDQLTDQ